ncbi:SH3 domain-containing protein [Flectobacillus longus]|uniref:SH3 domain-containing protein n=1 Tax=Flectobacillus longus TaxID=2984207 RepID=A0ABT6YT32_9BACT|nr:SH3 domain-containing protein [Flectobacillus longus]MDI9866762.1 SH3 domain-containing protein [Flectobacillus longus]MDI9881037.1 SH3 domain-containing protein [Flectobacillus longus]
MKKLYLLPFIIILSLTTKGQSRNPKKIFELGIWKGTITTDVSSKLEYYSLIKFPRVFQITINNNEIVGYGENIQGYSNIKEEILKTTDLNSSGRYLCFCNKKDSLLSCNFPDFSTSDTSFSFSGTDIFDFTFKRKINKKTYSQIIKVLSEEQYNYFRELLYYTSYVKNIKAYLYSNKVIPTKMYLIKGDEVEILEEKGEWLKIRYYGKKTIEGWIKRSDVE